MVDDNWLSSESAPRGMASASSSLTLLGVGLVVLVSFKKFSVFKIGVLRFLDAPVPLFDDKFLFLSLLK